MMVVVSKCLRSDRYVVDFFGAIMFKMSSNISNRSPTLQSFTSILCIPHLSPTSSRVTRGVWYECFPERHLVSISFPGGRNVIVYLTLISQTLSVKIVVGMICPGYFP